MVEGNTGIAAEWIVPRIGGEESVGHRGFESRSFHKGHGKAKANGLANRIVGTLIYV